MRTQHIIDADWQGAVFSMTQQLPDPPVSNQLSWPWQEGNELTLLGDGDHYLPAILHAMERATHRIDMELYLCESGRLFEHFLRVLHDACRRGIRVRLLLDAVGSSELRDIDRRRLANAGVNLLIFNRPRLGHRLQSLVRDHRKLVVVDSRIAFIGGMCITDRTDPRFAGTDAWLDAMVSMKGPLAHDCQALFEQAWRLGAMGPIRDIVRWRLGRQIAPVLATPTDTGPPRARVAAGRGGRRNPLLHTLIRHIRNAREDIWINTPYFFPPRALTHALRQAAERGVPTTLTLPGPKTDHPAMRTAGQYYYQRLLDAGVRILEYQPRFIHLKAASVDRWVTVGSTNYDRWDLHWNMDANMEALDDDFRTRLMELRHTVESQSRPVDPVEWSNRGRWQKMREVFWHWFGTRLLRLLQRGLDA